MKAPSCDTLTQGSLCENLLQAVIPSEARNLALNVFKGRA